MTHPSQWCWIKWREPRSWRSELWFWSGDRNPHWTTFNDKYKSFTTTSLDEGAVVFVFVMYCKYLGNGNDQVWLCINNNILKRCILASDNASINVMCFLSLVSKIFMFPVLLFYWVKFFFLSFLTSLLQTFDCRLAGLRWICTTRAKKIFL